MKYRPPPLLLGSRDGSRRAREARKRRLRCPKRTVEIMAEVTEAAPRHRAPIVVVVGGGLERSNSTVPAFKESAVATAIRSVVPRAQVATATDGDGSNHGRRCP
ncbi:hypothetical protein PR202_gb12033 [Eleusine coracana subsp. coracana]|uniref:Uncharacterized protein n=1 Tax=Eleusine coracana subsp. coracana TaxID=191504 RepID=A0AAV5ELQ5_ELECO|nr:hypothetical protein PR202_gb12033 [Eleusine coracana subsp. coracana]